MISLKSIVEIMPASLVHNIITSCFISLTYIKTIILLQQSNLINCYLQTVPPSQPVHYRCISHRSDKSKQKQSGNI